MGYVPIDFIPVLVTMNHRQTSKIKKERKMLKELENAANRVLMNKPTFYNGPLDISDQQQDLAFEAEPKRILSLIELVNEMAAALKYSYATEDCHIDNRNAALAKYKELAK
jgi:hypothetical protein